MTQKINPEKTVEAPHIENSPFSMLELKDAYLIEANTNEYGSKMFPIELNIQGEDNTTGYRYLIFPCLNERLYKN